LPRGLVERPAQHARARMGDAQVLASARPLHPLRLQPDRQHHRPLPGMRHPGAGRFFVGLLSPAGIVSTPGTSWLARLAKKKKCNLPVFAGISLVVSDQFSVISGRPGGIFSPFRQLFFTPGAAVVRRAIKKSANARKRPQSLGRSVAYVHDPCRSAALGTVATSGRLLGSRQPVVLISAPLRGRLQRRRPWKLRPKVSSSEGWQGDRARSGCEMGRGHRRQTSIVVCWKGARRSSNVCA
jgi:hypothetical protein